MSGDEGSRLISGTSNVICCWWVPMDCQPVEGLLSAVPFQISQSVEIRKLLRVVASRSRRCRRRHRRQRRRRGRRQRRRRGRRLIIWIEQESKLLVEGGSQGHDLVWKYKWKSQHLDRSHVSLETNALAINRRFFFTSLFLPAFLCQTFLAFISAPTGFHDWGLVTRWAQLLITSLTATYPAHRKIEVRINRR